MKKIYSVLLISLLLSGCGYQYERSRDRESAGTLQQKRDVLLKWTPFTVNNRHPGDPSNIYEARRNYIGHGEESDEFLSGLISQCYNSTSDLCAYDYYVNAANAENKKKLLQNKLKSPMSINSKLYLSEVKSYQYKKVICFIVK
ncbi:hypothetical protein ATS58_003354 [Salmonella enterica subsp. enterica serovar Pensacola]|nr:hypothetical protein [Salmonella enterica subsp. enterica serovar Pensacola]